MDMSNPCSKGEDEHNSKANCGGGQNVGCHDKTAINQKQSCGNQRQVCDNEREKRRAENFEEKRVEVLRKRAAGKIKQIAIQDRTIGQPPRDVELPAKIHEQIRPATPGNRGSQNEGNRDKHQARPRRIKPGEPAVTGKFFRPTLFWFRNIIHNKFRR
jgi:hypothetical protein